MSFEVGERVRCIRAYQGNALLINKVGTIFRRSSATCEVRFDKNIKGHSGATGRGTYGHHWNFPVTDIRRYLSPINEDDLFSLFKLEGINLFEEKI